MAATYRIAVIGDWESVMGFRALGLQELRKQRGLHTQGLRIKRLGSSMASQKAI